MPLCSASIMCRSPLSIPKVSSKLAAQCQPTALAMEQLAYQILDSSPDQILVVSPLTARLPDNFGISSQKIAGNFANFKAGGGKGQAAS